MIYLALTGWIIAVVLAFALWKKHAELKRKEAELLGKWNAGLMNLGCAWRYHTGETTVDLGQSLVPEARMYHKLAMRFYDE